MSCGSPPYASMPICRYAMWHSMPPRTHAHTHAHTHPRMHTHTPSAWRCHRQLARAMGAFVCYALLCSARYTCTVGYRNGRRYWRMQTRARTSTAAPTCGASLKSTRCEGLVLVLVLVLATRARGCVCVCCLRCVSVVAVMVGPRKVSTLLLQMCCHGIWSACLTAGRYKEVASVDG